MDKVIDIEERIPSMREKRRENEQEILVRIVRVRYCAPRDTLFPMTAK